MTTKKAAPAKKAPAAKAAPKKAAVKKAPAKKAAPAAAAPGQKDRKFVIDGKEYLWSTLSKDARGFIQNLNIVESEIRRLNIQVGINQTAHTSYKNALKAALAAMEA